LVEASTESEWVAQHLEGLGHVVIVADPNYAPMYGTRSRRIKTDRRDVMALADACRHGTYRAVHRRSAAQRVRQWELNARDQLVRTRTRAISGVRAVTRGVGVRVPGRGTPLVARVAALDVAADVRAVLEPLCGLITHTSTALADMDARLAHHAQGDPVCRRLMTAPGIGAVTALAFVAAIDDPRRFRTASQVAQYLGLVPHEWSSGERQLRGRVIRAAQPRVQRLLVHAGWRILRTADPGAAALRTWGLGIAGRRNRRVAVVALARRLARVLWAMWRDDTEFAPAPERRSGGVSA
jgi:transposase